MKHADFHIGLEFTTSDSALQWRCTDVGTRTIVAIRINSPSEPGPFNGPPYSVSEIVFDEYDLEGCAPRGAAVTPVLGLARAGSPASWLTLAEAAPENGDEVWVHTRRGGVEAATKAWKQGPTGDYFATEGAGDIAMRDVLHWMPRSKPLPPA